MKQNMLTVIACAIAAVAIIGLIAVSVNEGHIKDTNGDNDYSLQQITDSNILNMDIEALNCNKYKDAHTSFASYSSNKFTGVVEAYNMEFKEKDFSITVSRTTVNSGNFKLVLVCDDEIVHEFKLNEPTQTYSIENFTGKVSLRAAGESANFLFDYVINE